MEKNRLNLTPLEKKVLRIVMEIPLGKTRTYSWIAKKINRPKAVRAVANALKKNPLPIIIPCHRVIRKDGSIGGYLFGERFKKRLLEIEKIISKRI